MNRWSGSVVFAVLLAALMGSISLGQDYPDCSWNCRSTDVVLEAIYLDGAATCVTGGTVRATLMGVFANGTRANRYDVALLADLVILTDSGNTVSSLDVTSLTSTIPPGTSNLPIAQISFPCGAGVELRDALISWDTKAGGDLSCASRTAKCSSDVKIVVSGMPLAAAFDASTSACIGVPVAFVDQTSGGTPPYTSYVWDFGDGVGVSSNANPSYAYTSAGTFTVQLTVTDGGNTVSASKDIRVEEQPSASATNGGPYCNGSDISLHAEGGVAYSWSGPNGFSSSSQNPVVVGGVAGIYTVTVANAAGCSSTASTNVVFDDASPDLVLPADTTVECGQDISPSSTGQATAADLAGSLITITYDDAFIAGGCGSGTGVIERTWTAIDSCGNTASGPQLITITDTAAPALTVSSLTLECDGAGNVDEIDAWLQSPVVWDACDVVTLTHDLAEVTDTCPGVGEAVVTFTATDGCGNAAQRTATLSIHDTTAPTAAPETVTVDVDSTSVIDVLANDSDACAAQLSLISVSTPARGVAVVSGTNVSYRALDEAGPDSFTYVVEDCSGLQTTGQVSITILARNHAPVANDASVTTAEDTATELAVTASDPDGDVLSFSLVSEPSNGAISGFNSETGALTYIPALNFFGDDSFEFEACDPDGVCDTATVTITITPVDDQIVAEDQSVTMLEDTASPIRVYGSDEDGNPVIYGITTEPSHGAISGFNAATGELVYTPSPHYTGPDSFTFEVCDPFEADECTQGIVTILVTPVNDAPEAADQVRATAEDTATGFFALAITDPDNTLAELVCDCVTPPPHGSVERGPNHTVNYTPESNYTGTDTFTYSVCDPDGLCDTATVTVTVSSENDNPSVSASNQTTPEDTPIDIAVTHSDPDGDPLTCTAGTPSHGTVNPQSGTINGPYPETGILTYTPEKDFVGVDQIVVQCSDGNGGSDSVTIEITVTPLNDRPEANDAAVTTSEDASTPIALIGSDVDSDVLTYTIIGDPNHGEVTGFNPATGALIYTPAHNYNGLDEIVFQVCDPTNACDTGVVTITIEPVDDNPIPDPQAVTTQEDVSRDIVLTATEPDGEALSYGIVSGPSHGTIAGFNEATGQLRYVPNANYVGTDSFVFETCDPDVTHGCPQATVTITVTPVNDPPRANSQSVTTLEGRPLNIVLTGSDVDGDVLTYAVAASPGHGAISGFNGTTGELAYTPNPLFFGTDHLTFTVCDPEGTCAQATVTIEVLPSNDPPVANDAAVTTTEDMSIELTLSASDPDGDALVYGIVSGPSNGAISGFNSETGALTYIPALNFYGDDSFEFEACDPDGACDTGVVSITVEPADDNPVPDPQDVATPEDTPIVIQVTGSDPDGDAVIFNIVSQTSHGTISGFDTSTGQLIYTPQANYTGTDHFVFEICDPHAGHGCPQATVTITVMPVNDAPVAANQERATSEDTATGFFALAISDPDDALADLVVEIVLFPEHGELDVGPNHTANYVPEPNYTGSDAFTYSVCDPGGLCDTATVTLTISEDNDNPILSAENVTTMEDTPIDILVTHTDPDGDTLDCTISDPAHGGANPTSGTIEGPYPRTTTFTYTPDRDFTGVDQVVVRCDDGNGGSDTVTIQITVAPVNDRPVANDEAVTMAEDTSESITVTGSDEDEEVLRYEILSGPDHGVVSSFDEEAGTFIYTPNRDYHGQDEIVFQICDPSNACDTGVVAIQIEPVDDNPIAEPQEVTTPEDTGKTIVLTAVEPDGEALTYELVSEPNHGAIEGFDALTGALIYMPDKDFVGTDSFTFMACDPHAGHGCPQAIVTVTVTPVNDPPRADDHQESTLEDNALVAQLPGADIDSDDLIFSFVGLPNHGAITGWSRETGSYTYVPDDDFNGSDSFEYQVCDPSGACDRAIISIDVIPVNDDPVARSDSKSTFQDVPIIDFQLSATDLESTSLTYSILLPPRAGDLGVDPETGAVRYLPDPGYVGGDSFLFRACDPEGACDTGLVFLDVIDTNDAPTAVYLETSVTQGEVTQLDMRATDPDEEPLTFSIVSAPLHGSISSFSPTTGAFTYTSNATYEGPDLIRFQACDASGACDIGVIQLSVVSAGGGGISVETCPNVVISEVAWSGTAAGEDHQWVELRNLEAFPIGLTGWTLRMRPLKPILAEDRAWRTVPLSGLITEYQVIPQPALDLSAWMSSAWHVSWPTIPTSDHYVIEIGDDDRVLPYLADMILPQEDEFGLALQLPEGGALLELRGPTGCLADTANIERLGDGGWAAGSISPPASMERTNIFAADAEGNWHTNLGLIRTGFDAFGNLNHGTAGVVNSPRLDLIDTPNEVTALSHPMGEPIELEIAGDAIWSSDPNLWYVVILRPGVPMPLDASWSVSEIAGTFVIRIETNTLPLNVELGVWIRTPTGAVLFAPYRLYPY